MNLKYSIKIRSDCYFTNIDAIINNIDLNKINFLYFCNYLRNNISYQYFVDYAQFGKTEDLLNIWDFNSEVTDLYAEYHLSKHIFKNIDISNIVFIGNTLSKENDIYWRKKNLFISNYNNDKNYKLNI